MTSNIQLFDPARSRIGGASARGPSRLSAVTTCPRKWVLRYVNGYETNNEPEYRLLGTLIHLVVAFHHAHQLPVVPAWALAKSVEDLLGERAPGRPAEIRLALDVGKAYEQIDAGRAWQVLGVEQEIGALIGELWPEAPPDVRDERITAGMDLAVAINGWMQIVDTKTKNPRGNSLGSYRDQGEHTWQAAINLHLARHELKRCGVEVEAFNIQRVTRRLPLEVDLHAIPIPPDVYAAAPRTAAMLVRQENELLKRFEGGQKPEPYFHSCYGRYGPCDYFTVCHAPDRKTGLFILENDFKIRAGY